MKICGGVVLSPMECLTLQTQAKKVDEVELSDQDARTCYALPPAAQHVYTQMSEKKLTSTTQNRN